MFGSMRKKRRQPAQPLTTATADPNAATAAAAVFGRRDSNNSLSSAAAAAALRARPTTPINVGEVQTRRTMRRTASQSSHGSHHDPRLSLQRSPSQSSMTERTFRSPSPSPHRPATSAGYEEPPPPVPSIPDDIRSNDGTNGQKRHVQMYTQPFRVASQKNSSGAGSWFGAATAGDTSNIRTADAVLRTKSPDPRDGAVSPSLSINFSYPRGSRVASPSASPAFERTTSMTQSQRYIAPRRSQSTNTPSSSASADQGLVFDPNSRRMVPKTDLATIEHSVQAAADRPVKKKKKSQQQQQTGVSRSGSHLAKGSVSRLQGTAVDSGNVTPQLASPAPEVQAPGRIAESPEPKTLHHPRADEAPSAMMTPASLSTTQQSPAPVAETPPEFEAKPEPAADVDPRSEQPVVTEDVRVSDGATILPHADSTSAKTILGMPVPVDDETTDDEDQSLVDSAALPAEPSATTDATDFAPVRNAASPPPQTPAAAAYISPSTAQAESSVRYTPSPAPILKQHGSIRSAREPSSSPVRTPRFAVTPDQLVVKHEPPPRSVSPRKSALKNSASPSRSRGASPSDDGSEVSGFGGPNDDGSVQRKKSVRVSFDDQSTKVIGEGAQEQYPDSPVVPSPQTTARRPWYSSIGRGKKKDIAALDDDEVMKPRPALPMFGSVREKKPRESEERPLVRPAETARSPLSATPSTLPSSPDEELEENPIGQSSDHNIAAVLNQDLASKNEANTSRYREPLPPVVTSMEGSGYYSASSSSSEDEDELETDTAVTTQPEVETVKEPEPTLLPPAQVQEEVLAEGKAKGTLPVSQHATTEDRSDDQRIDTIPTISIIQPSPRFKEPEEPEEAANVEQQGRVQPGYFDVPGGFPDDESDHSVKSPPTTQSSGVQAQPAGPAQVMPGDFDDELVEEQHSPTAAKTPLVATIEEESETSSGDSIYSDAYEDISETEGDGFMSLDAVLTTPVSDKVSQTLFAKTLAASSHATEERAPPTAAAVATSATENVPTETADDWEKAKSYWKGLTLEKRKQLEQEAMEDAGVEADREAVAAPVVRPKKKRTSKAPAVPEPKLPAPEPQIDASRVYQIKPGTRATDGTQNTTAQDSNRIAQQQPVQGTGGKLRKSMRGGAPAVASAAPAAGTSMRKTLRSGPQDDAGGHATQTQNHTMASGGMRKSLRQNGTTQPIVDQPPASKPARPVSVPQPPKAQVTSKQQKRATLGSSAAEAASANMQPTLRRRGSDSSESSFKRARPTRQGFGFRSSMRANSPERPSTAGRSSRFSLRSLSPPPASPPPVSMGNRMSMRSTLRSDSSDGSTSKMRIPGFGRKKTEKRKERRFDDSSDDDITVTQPTRASRVVDSSDEDEPLPLPKVSGLAGKSMRNGGASSSAAAAAMKTTRPAQRADSPDLPDSDDDDEDTVPQRTASGRLLKPQNGGSGLQRKRSGRGELLVTAAPPTEAPVRPGHTRKGSFFSILRRKKDKEAGKITRPERTDSFARQGTKLERSTEELTALRGNNTSPKLQKQQMSSWPLPETAAEEKRPSTAGPVAPPPMAGKPSFIKRRSTSYQGAAGQASEIPRQLDEESAVDGHSQADGSVKKKKFGKLRKMFGLND